LEGTGVGLVELEKKGLSEVKLGKGGLIEPGSKEKACCKTRSCICIWFCFFSLLCLVILTAIISMAVDTDKRK